MKYRNTNILENSLNTSTGGITVWWLGLRGTWTKVRHLCPSSTSSWRLTRHHTPFPFSLSSSPSSPFTVLTLTATLSRCGQGFRSLISASSYSSPSPSVFSCTVVCWSSFLTLSSLSWSSHTGRLVPRIYRNWRWGTNIANMNTVKKEKLVC